MSTTVVNKYRLYCNTEATHVYAWDTSAPTTCPNNDQHNIDTNSVTVIDTVSEEAAGRTSALNSAPLALGIGDEFVGAYEEVDKYSEITILVILGQGQVASMCTHFSIDATGTIKRTKYNTIGDGSAQAFTFAVVSKYFSVSVLAERDTVVTGSIQVIYHKYKSKNISSFVDEPITNSSTCELVRAVLTGATLGKNYENVTITHMGKQQALDVALASPLTAFGELLALTTTPIIQISNAYEDAHNQVYLHAHRYDSNGASQSTVTSANSSIVVKASTAPGSYSMSHSRQIAMYRPGQGMHIRFSGRMPNGGIANTYQILGYGNHHNGLYIGFKGLDFGIVRRSGGKPTIYKVQVTTAATINGNVTLTLDGVAYTVPVTAAPGAAPFSASEIAKRGTFRDASNNETRWYSQAIDDSVYWIGFNPGPRTGTYSFVDTDNTGLVIATGAPQLLYQGTHYAEEFIPSTEFNGDKLDGTGASGFLLDPTKGNVYEIQMQWLGFGTIGCRIEVDNGHFVTFHQLIYNNRNVVPSLEVPHAQLNFLCETMPGGPAASAHPEVHFTSALVAVEGNIFRTVPKYSVSNSTVLFGTTERNVLVLRGRREFHSRANYTEAHFTAMSFAVTSGNTAVKFRIYLNPTISPTSTIDDYPIYTHVNQAGSFLTYDTNSKTLSNGTVVIQYIITRDNALTVTSDVLKNFQLSGAEIIAITAKGNSNSVDVSVSWIEDH